MCVCVDGGKKEKKRRGGEGNWIWKMKVWGEKDVLLRGRRTKAGLAHEQKPMSSVNLSPDSQ